MPNRNLLQTYKTTTKKLLSTSQKPASYCIEAARQILQTDSTQSHAYYVYGLALRDKAQPQLQQSKIYIEQARKLNPCFYNAMQNNEENVLKFIKVTCTQLQKFMKEADFLEKKWYDVLTMFAKKKDFNSCIVFMKVFEAEKKKVDLSAQQLSTLGLVSYEAGSYVQSARYYREAITLKPGQYKYYNNLSILSLILDNPGQTVQLITKSLQLKPGYAKSSFLLSFSLCCNKQYEQALSLALVATNDSPKSIMFRLKVLTILLQYFPQRQDQIQIHFKQIQSIIANSEDSDSYFFIKDNIEVVNVFLMGVKQGMNLLAEQDVGLGRCWRRFIGCMNQFLLKGHFDKYWLGIQIKELQTKISNYYNKKQQQKAKEQLVNSEKKEQGIQGAIESTEKKQQKSLAEVVEVTQAAEVTEASN